MITPFGFIQSAAAADLLLDTYTGAEAAYSVRKLSNSYAGNCMTVYKTTGGTTQDFGFDGDGYLDVAGIESFLAGSDGYVSKWYDQSGNSRDIIIASISNYPKLASAGTVFTDNGGKASFQLVANYGHDLGFKLRGDKTVASVLLNYTVAEPTFPSVSPRIIGNYAGSGGVGTQMLADVFQGSSGGIRVFDGLNNVSCKFPDTTFAAGTVLAAYTKDTGTITGIANGDDTASGTTTGYGDSSDINLYVFDDRGGTNSRASAGMSELIIWSTTHEVNAVSDAINTFYSIY